jgi:glycosyltransferase involved in cell wall biosynthesis
MRFIYPGAKVLALPSIYEPFGNAAIEAMASGVPVVGSKIGGLADTITHGKTGYHINQGDAKQLSRYLNDLLIDEKLRRKMSRVAREIAVERFDDMAIARTVERLYRKTRNS